MYDEKNGLDPLGLDADVIMGDDAPVKEQPEEDTVKDTPVTEELTTEAPAAESEEQSDKTEEVAAEEPADVVAEALEENSEEEAPAAEDETVEEAPVDAESVDAEPVEAEGVVNAEEETEKVTEPVEPQKVLVEFSREEFEQLISGHFSAIAYAVNALRSKDDSITRLSKEVQKYREDYCAKSFKSIAMTLIGLRESCRKSIASLDKPIEFVKIKKYVNYLVDDLDDLMSEIGLECEKSDGYVWTYNGTPLFKKSVETVTFPDGFTLCECEPLTLPELGDSFTEYLTACEETVKAALADMSRYDACINDYVKVAGSIDEGILAANVYPVLRALVHFAPRFKADVIEALNTLTEENAATEYRALLEVLVDKLATLLEMGGVEVEAVHGGTYDLKKHKIIKLVPTDDESLDRAVESVSTDCYSLGGLVIAQAKINAYKYQPSNG